MQYQYFSRCNINFPHATFHTFHTSPYFVYCNGIDHIFSTGRAPLGELHRISSTWLILKGTFSCFVHWKDPKGNFIMDGQLEWHPRWYCITFSPLEGTLEGTVPRFLHWMDAKGHFGMFCPLEGHLKGHCITFSPLEGRSRWHFIMFYLP